MSAKVSIKAPEPIGIIAGSGSLFSMVLEEAYSQHLQPVVVLFKDDEDLQLDDQTPSLHTTLGKIGEILTFFKSHQVSRLIFAGRIARPSFSALSFDSTGLKWAQKLGMKAFSGDDALLKAITALLNEEGFHIISPRDFLPNLILKPGVYSKTQPNDQNMVDITRGLEVLNALSSADVGQACIIQDGLVLGIEAIEGTQKLINRCAQLKPAPKGGVLVKIAKRDQSTLMDLPTIGTDTIEAIHTSGLSGIAISANTTQVLQYQKVVALCNQYDLFLKVV